MWVIIERIGGKLVETHFKDENAAKALRKKILGAGGKVICKRVAS